MSEYKKYLNETGQFNQDELPQTKGQAEALFFSNFDIFPEGNNRSSLMSYDVNELLPAIVSKWGWFKGSPSSHKIAVTTNLHKAFEISLLRGDKFDYNSLENKEWLSLLREIVVGDIERQKSRGALRNSLENIIPHFSWESELAKGFFLDLLLDDPEIKKYVDTTYDLRNQEGRIGERVSGLLSGDFFHSSEGAGNSEPLNVSQKEQLEILVSGLQHLDIAG